MKAVLCIPAYAFAIAGVFLFVISECMCAFADDIFTVINKGKNND